MKRISLWFFLAALTTFTVRAQDTATQQQLDKLSGQIQDVLAAQGKQDQVLAELRREIAELREKVNTPQVNDSASRSDLRALAEKVQEVDRKRLEDRKEILENIEKVARAVAAPPPATRKNNTAKPPPKDEPGAAPVAMPGHDYVVKEGDTLGLIVKAYRDGGVKVTKAQVIAANPKMNPNVLIPGKTIFIPDPNAK